MIENDDETLSLRDKLHQAISRSYWRRVRLMRTDPTYRLNNGLMVFGSIPAFLFCVMWLFVIDDPQSPHPFNLGFNLFFGFLAIIFGLAVIWGVKEWIDSRKSN